MKRLPKMSAKIAGISFIASQFLGAMVMTAQAGVTDTDINNVPFSDAAEIGIISNQSSK